MARRICTIEGCDKFVEGHGWCSKHYTRWQRYGSPTARMRGEVVDGCKICPGCGVDKPLADYGARANERCLKCQAERMRQRRAVKPAPQRPKFEAICGNCGSA